MPYSVLHYNTYITSGGPKAGVSNERFSAKVKLGCHNPGQNIFEQEPCGHPTSASNVAWIIVNYSSTRVNWPLLALYDWEGVDSRPRYSENNVTVEVGQ